VGSGGSRGAAAVLIVAAIAAVPASALAHESSTAAAPAPLAAPAGCSTMTDGGDPIQPDRVITGEFGGELQGGYVMLPFTVPSGTDAVRVKYCYDQPEYPLPSQLPNAPKHTLDLGLYEARSGPADLWDSDEFRGWGGSSHPDVTVSPNGFSSEAEYIEAPQRHRRGHTTRGFIPGPVPKGQWAVELGVASIASQEEGDADGKVAWRVEIDLIRSRDYRNERYQPAAYDPTPANPNPGWYAGDFHVHSEHSNLGAAPISETFDYAFSPIVPGDPSQGAGLDFITLSDYVTTSAWGEVGRYQPAHPGKLIVRSAEVITYRGHANNHASLTWADYRTGPIYERQGDGSLTAVRAPRPASTIFDTVHGGGGWTQINHPTIFPSQVPGFAGFCRGCPWDYNDEETDYSKVDAIEVATGPAGLKAEPYPGLNPFTASAIQFYEHALDTGARVAAVGSSDSHTAGRDAGNTTDITSAPIGMATTVVYADQLSERAIGEGVRAGHTYVKIWGNDGPDLRFSADHPGSVEPAIMGDTVEGGSTTFHARVLKAGAGAARPGAYTLLVVKDGVPAITVPITSDDFSFDFPSTGPGRYRLEVMRTTSGVASIENVSSPIYLEP
jgi:hypothetical protein